ncbi:MAG TPA: VOC family protein [Gaiellales bacterium]|nr:VOC family protein [Gaiellales bacterium]
MRVFRIAIPASRIDRSRVFYEHLLGIDADDTVPTRLYFRCGDVILALIDWGAGDRPPFRPAPEQLYFATGDVDAVRRRAVAAGAVDVSDIEVRPWGERSFYCLDPDGNRLSFVEEGTLYLGRGAARSSDHL